MFKPNDLRIDYGRLNADNYSRVAENKNPVFTWAGINEADNAFQNAYNIIVTDEFDSILWDSGWVETKEQRAVYAGTPLKIDECLYIDLTLRDNYGTVSETLSEYFYLGDLGEWTAEWITTPEHDPDKAIYFYKEIETEKEIECAYFYVCGLGYQSIYLNGFRIDTAPTAMSPAFSDYSKTCYYTVNPRVYGFDEGINKIEIVVGNGWRHCGRLSQMCKVPPKFQGTPQLTAIIDIRYADGTAERVTTDTSWMWSYGPIQMNDVYCGETYDAGYIAPEPENAVIAEKPCSIMRPQTFEPIVENEVYMPLTMYSPEKGIYIFDMGQNIAGVPRIILPDFMDKGQVITVKHAEILDEDGTLYTAPLRGAKCTDTYIASGDERDLQIWQPEFTYHGFRYIQLEGWSGVPDLTSISAVALYTDIKNKSFFTCGNPLVNQIHTNVVQTEKSNIHGILTDCPQRDERMGWMNDATVRFEETPYNFNTGKIFEKVIRDLLDVQNDKGAITCTAPYIWGGQPADAVCSSFLVAGLESLMHSGNIDIVKEAYDGFAAWEDCLIAHSDDYIVNYSYYGDWAGPAYACVRPEDAKSGVTPGILMSTGYSYYNAKTLEFLALQLGRQNDAGKYSALADKIKTAFLNKWWNPETAVVATGSQACQTFALWLGILPVDKRAAAAEVLHNDLVKNDYKITTGNLCTRYIFDVLSDFGYLEDAWKLITREEYPSYGFMIQNEATTVWERFELKKDPGMNSHNHPMYGAVGYWFYSYLCGIKILSPSCQKILVKPYMPKELLSAQASVDSVKGAINVKWVKRYGKTHMYVAVPFGVEAEIHADNNIYNVGSGYYHYEWQT